MGSVVLFFSVMFLWSLCGITLHVVCDNTRHVVCGITLHVVLLCDVSLVPQWYYSQCGL